MMTSPSSARPTPGFLTPRSVFDFKRLPAAERAQQQDEDGLPDNLGKAGEGACVGSAIGGAFGTVAAIGVAAGSSFVVPGLGMVLAGPLAAAIGGAGVGAAVGGAFGALVGWISPEDLL